MTGAVSGLRYALTDSNLVASRAARIFIGQMAEHGQIMLGVNDTILEEAHRAIRIRSGHDTPSKVVGRYIASHTNRTRQEGYIPGHKRIPAV